MPRSHTEVYFENEWPESIDGKQFLLVEDGDVKKIIIFATDDNMKLLAEAETLFVDGTFHTCPEIFYQIFTVHAFKNGQQFPLAYCLLPDKTPGSYQWTFTLLKAKAEKLHLEFSPNNVVTDFELAIIQAAEFSFRNNHRILLPLLSMSKQEDTADRPSSCLSGKLSTQSICEEDSCFGICATEICTTGMASS